MHYTPLGDGVSPPKWRLFPFRALAGALGLGLLFLTSLISHNALFHPTTTTRTSEAGDFVPKGGEAGLQNVLVRPGLPGSLQALSPRKRPGCLFVYTKDAYDHDKKGAQMEDDCWVYGAKLDPESGLATPTGNPADVLKGRILCWPANTFMDHLASAEADAGYDSGRPEGPPSRSVVWAVRKDGSSARAFWFFKMANSPFPREYSARKPLKKASSQRTNQQLQADAEIIFPIVTQAHNLWAQKHLTQPDLVGIFILAACAVRRPNSWLLGKLPQPIITPHPTIRPQASIAISAIEGLWNVCGGEEYLGRKLGERARTLTVFQLFNEMGLSGIKKNDGYINQAMAHWYMGERPFALLFHSPSPLDVLRQQARGERVVTLFLRKQELARRHEAALVYMAAGDDHSKDALEVTLHDLKHMENFINPNFHQEQVGFFRCLLGLQGPNEKEAAEEGEGIEALFRDRFGLDEALWKELVYVFSDMNAYSPYMLQYMFAKLLFAVQRKAKAATELLRLQESQLDDQSLDLVALAKASAHEAKYDQDEARRVKAEMGEIWGDLLDQFGMSSKEPARHAAEDMLGAAFEGRPALTEEEMETIRAWFKNVAVKDRAVKKKKAGKRERAEQCAAVDKALSKTPVPSKILDHADMKKLCDPWAKNIESILFTSSDIAKRVSELAAQIGKDYKGEPILAVGLLNGCMVFIADLLRELPVQYELDFMVVSSYGRGTSSSGSIKIKKDLNIDPMDKHVLIVEDLIDTGNTLVWVTKHILSKGAKTVKIVTLLDKVECRKANVSVDYAGFICPNEFVVGYGMDFAEEYRCLPFVGVLKPEAYAHL